MKIGVVISLILTILLTALGWSLYAINGINGTIIKSLSDKVLVLSDRIEVNREQIKVFENEIEHINKKLDQMDTKLDKLLLR